MFLPLLALALLQEAPSWDVLHAAYSYDKPQAVKVTQLGPSKYDLVFTGSLGDTVHAVLGEPKSGDKFPVVVLLHGLMSNKEQVIENFGDDLNQHGIAYAAIDAPGHGARATAGDKQVASKIMGDLLMAHGDFLKSVATGDADRAVYQFLDRAVINGIIDNRKLLDVVAARPEIDANRIGLIGYSMGSIMGAIFGSVDKRIKDMALLVGGDPVLPLIPSVPENIQQEGYFTSSSLYAPHFGGFVLMENASKDSIVPRSATDRLYAAFPEAKRTIQWYDSNHILPAKASDDAVAWMAQNLK